MKEMLGLFLGKSQSRYMLIIGHHIGEPIRMKHVMESIELHFSIHPHL